MLLLLGCFRERRFTRRSEEALLAPARSGQPGKADSAPSSPGTWTATCRVGPCPCSLARSCSSVIGTRTSSVTPLASRCTSIVPAKYVRPLVEEALGRRERDEVLQHDGTGVVPFPRTISGSLTTAPSVRCKRASSCAWVSPALHEMGAATNRYIAPSGNPAGCNNCLIDAAFAPRERQRAPRQNPADTLQIAGRQS